MRAGISAFAGMRGPINKRFWGRVEKTGGCWNWTGPIGSERYGRIRFQGRRVLTHVISYRLSFGAVPSGLSVLHRCDNPRCVRPDHLYAGTAKDNVWDAITRGRRPRGPNLRLTSAEVTAIRAKWRAGESQRAIAGECRVSPSTISLAARGKTWARMEEA